jgi:SAM-dependent methyltransferase
VHSCLLLGSAAEAQRFPRGSIALALCSGCGCIWNTAFEESLVAYGRGYEASQGASPRFRRFAEELIDELVGRYGIRDADVLEIGCGQGDFLLALCDAGLNHGLGIDPAADPGAAAGRDNVVFFAEPYPGRFANINADLYVCRHTLEHLPAPGKLVRSIRDGSARSGNSLVFLEVPDAGRVLEEGAFWDVYYEHCCYFTQASFALLAESAGLDILEQRLGFDAQYLLLFARAGSGRTGRIGERDYERLHKSVERFRSVTTERIDRWRGQVDELRSSGRRAALWGAGSKAVAFLSALEPGDEVAAVVDIDPRKHGLYMAGTGRPIDPPASLAATRPDLVVVMNPVYRDEIAADLERLGVDAEIATV